MGKTKFAFVVFTAVLVLGIFILMKPHVFSLPSPTNDKTLVTEQSVERIVPRQVIILGSALIILGLVGLSVLGFRLFKDLMAEANSK